MAETRTLKIGIHGRNDYNYPESDYQMVKRARIEAIKGMSYTGPQVYQRLQRDNQNLEVIIRLDWAERVNERGHPSPEEFRDRFVPVMNNLRSVTTKFEVLNEPNHSTRIGGWGPTRADAENFNAWFLRVYELLKAACPWALIGYPGLAIPHGDFPDGDLGWVEVTRSAVNRADWLCVHCYWQTPPGQPENAQNHLSDAWGLRFKAYHQKFPDKIIDITEFGNSNGQSGYTLADGDMARQYIEYYQELFKYPYLNSASAFIASSPDPTWNSQGFSWVRPDGSFRKVVEAVGDMPRPPLVPAAVEEEAFVDPETGRRIVGLFLRFYQKYGLDICGRPITDRFMENGMPSQYFQRIALEEYESGKARLKLVGSEALASRDTIKALREQIGQLSQGMGIIGPPPIQDITDSLPHHPTKQYGTRALDQITLISINHTATGPTITPQRIAEVQVNQQGRPGISYHYFIAADGTIYQTNALTTVSEHTGQFSPESVGIGFAGNFTTDIPTDAQLGSGGRLCAYLLQTLHLNLEAIKGASELIQTQSPGLQWLQGRRWKDTLLEQTRAALAAGGPAVDLESLRRRIAELEGEVAQQKAEIARLEAQIAVTPPPVVARPAIEDVTDKLPRHETLQYQSRSVDSIQILVMHHSAVPASVGVERIASYYVQNLQWPGIGFHYFITAEGRILQTNALTTVSYHAKDADPVSVGICLAGNFTDVMPPAQQLDAAAQLCTWLLQELKLPIEAIKGHKDYVVTQCPGNQWDGGSNWRQALLDKVKAIQASLAAVPVSPAAKPLEHYVLFWQYPDSWAQKDWEGAENYIGRFRPTCGFSLDDALRARYVTIIGGPLGVSTEVEQLLRQSGCIVERIAGADEAKTKKILDDLAKKGQRFLTIVPA
jgi:N-acetyl-anhydromuramyl-L-alanine amidase AmpD